MSGTEKEVTSTVTIDTTTTTATGKETKSTSSTSTTTTTTPATSTTTMSTTTRATETTSEPEAPVDAVLALYYTDLKNKALVTGVAGEVTDLDWQTEVEAISRSLCSLTFQGEMFIYGQVLTNKKFSCYLFMRMPKKLSKDQHRVILTTNTKSALWGTVA